ncbi:hypothetical protein EV363DRAFT_79127 [Boletus edulis]|nr:hypothetical protein EV363DRAFT_79127 [Boletus edulis]
MSLNNLAVRYDHLGVMEDLDQVIVLDREFLDLLPKGRLDWSKSLYNLAHHLRDRFTRLGQSKDKEEIFSLYAELVQLPKYVSSSDLYTAPFVFLVFVLCGCKQAIQYAQWKSRLL